MKPTHPTKIQTLALTALITLFLGIGSATADPADETGYQATYDAYLTYSGEREASPLGQIVETVRTHDVTSDSAVLDRVVLGEESVLELKSPRYLSRSRIETILKDCVAKGHELVTVSVPAGTFETCKVAKPSEFGMEYTYYGRVPLGLVKLERGPGNVIGSELVLVDFKTSP